MDKIGPSPILSVIHPVTIDAMLNNNGLKTLHVNKTYQLLLLI